MRPIPKKLREEMASDPFYKRCCITNHVLGKIEWHHHLIFAGKQVNEKWCILPISKFVHDNLCHFKKKLNWIMYNRATDEELKKYSGVVNLISERDKLNKLYGK